MAEIRIEPRVPPSVGRIVHYHFPEGHPRGGGAHEPYAALVILVGPRDHVEGEGRVRLRVFCDAALTALVAEKELQDENVEAVWSPEPKAGCWNWPPRT